MKKLFLMTLVSMVVLTNCSIQKFALKTTSGLFSYGIEAIYSEPDLKIAEHAIASNLKLLEGFHLADPKNKEILQMLTQGFASYSLVFLEDEEPDRASLFYLRSKGYGLKLLRKTKAFKDSIPTKEANFVKRLALIKKSDTSALFWTAFSWAGWINLNRDNPQAVFELNIVKAMMNRVLELDESFFFGSAHLFFGSINASLPKMLGGDLEKAREHFERCIELTDGKFLMANVYLARYYALSTLNEELFDETLVEVIEAPQDILPGYELMTSVAKDKAKKLAEQKEDLF
jgi:hypothetical protein